MATATGGKKPAPGGPRRRTPLYTIEGHIWIEGREGAFLGLGRITLLERIGEFGSITRAAKSINMSYRRAWELVESMNRQAATPMVTASAGGTGGGGAVLTPAGIRAIEEFRRLDSEFRAFRQKQALRMERLGKD